jgi:hypothetical protein
MRLARAVRGTVVLLLATAGLWSCYNPSFVSGVTKCSPSGACPNNWVCQAGVCVDVANGGAGGSVANGGSTGTGGNAANGGHAGGGTAGTAGTAGITGAAGTGGHAGSGATGGHAGSGAAGSSAGGSGGVVGAAGNTGAGGSTGGAAGSPPTCIEGATMAPAGALITDFSDAVPDTGRPPGDFSFGSVSGFPGGTTRFASGTLGTATLSNGALVFGATVEAPSANDMYPYNGLHLFLDGTACINGSQYTGISFDATVSGNCPLYFEFNDSEHTLQMNDTSRGTCQGSSATCYPSAFSVTSGHNRVAFAGTPAIGGSPTATVDARKLLGVQWQMQVPSTSATGCTGTLTLDNVSFY